MALGMLAVATLGCSHSRTTTRTPTRGPGNAKSSLLANGYVHEDGDKDEDETLRHVAKNDDRSTYRTFGSSAGAADTRTIARLVRRYYAAAAAGDGATACSLLDATLVRTLELGGNGRGCAQLLSPQMAQLRQLLSGEGVDTITVLYVHVKGALGIAALGLRSAPEQEIVVDREHGVWRVDSLAGSDVT
jgi:hypothetical protein